MTEIRVEEKETRRAWLWIVMAIIALIAAAFVLGRLGYVDLPVRVTGR